MSHNAPKWPRRLLLSFTFAALLALITAGVLDRVIGQLIDDDELQLVASCVIGVLVGGAVLLVDARNVLRKR